MKRTIVCALLALLSACALPTGDDGTVVRLDQEFTLPEGRTALVLGPRIAVDFIGVVEDHRCPIEALCVSAGNATVRVRVAQEGFDPAVLELRTDEPGGYKVYNYHAVELLELDPPASTRVPDPDYRARLRVYPVFTTGGRGRRGDEFLSGAGADGRARPRSVTGDLTEWPPACICLRHPLRRLPTPFPGALPWCAASSPSSSASSSSGP